jgi:hypothetical protein
VFDYALALLQLKNEIGLKFKQRKNQQITFCTFKQGKEIIKQQLNKILSAKRLKFSGKGLQLNESMPWERESNSCGG